MNNVKYKGEFYQFREITDLKDLINSSAELYADIPAYLVKDKPGGVYRPISFRQMKEDIDCLGTAMMDLKLTGKNIALIGENRYEWMVSHLAVACGVGVIVPLDRELPAVEIRHLLERADASAIVFSAKLEGKVKEAIQGLEKLEHVISMDLPEHTEEVLSLKQLIEMGRRLIREEKRCYVDAVIDPDEMRLLLFTSGTTGMAKGVMLSHKNICANVMNMSKVVDASHIVGLSVLPMHHTYEFTCHNMTCLYQGSTIAICEGLKYIVKNMAEAKANVMLGVPLIFESMHKKVWKKAESSGKADKMRAAIAVSKTLNKLNIKAAKRLFKDVHQAMGGHLQMLIVGAAACDPAVISDFNAMGINTFQGYGMTESAPIIAVNQDRYHKDASAGLPMPGTLVEIIDKDENGIGEIICKSDSVMLGYYKDPEETAKVLKDGWLYTGDYGYFDNDGFLYIAGRKKNVIVTKNGKNIFPEEVEFYLGKSPYIAEVLVSGTEDPKSGETVVCAEILPDLERIGEDIGRLPGEALHKLMKKEIDAANDNMPLYKRVKRFTLRDTEFEKTTTKKIKRTYS